MRKRKMAAWVLSLAMVLTLLPTTALATSVRGSEPDEPQNGNVKVTVNAKAVTEKSSKILARMNQIRKEACNQRVYYMDYSGAKKRLKSSDYVPLKWSSDLEQIALTRAVEAGLYMQHERPNGLSFYTATYKGKSSSNEILAWGLSPLYSIEAWYMEKQFGYTSQAGHYYAMINPKNRYVGLAGSYLSSNRYKQAVAGEFLTANGGSTKQIGKKGYYLQSLEVKQSRLSGVSMSGDSMVPVGKTSQMKVKAKSVKYNGSYSNIRITKPIVWTSSNEEVATVSASGYVRGVGEGTAIIRANIGSKSYSKKVTVPNPNKPGPPSTLSTSLVKYNAVKIRWSKVENATGYYVYCKRAGKESYFLVAKTKGTSVTKYRLMSGKKYYVRVIPYRVVGELEYFAYANANRTFYTMKRVSRPSVTKSRWNQVKVTWKNISGESGYQISKSSKKNGTYVVATYKTTTGKSKKLSARYGKTYYYKVRAFKTVNGKRVYAPWSKVKAYRIK